eukprot:m.477069 g.477069  ORF g.477069 m.477069 type:complete len:836 (-) comp20747_c0_seq1:704-3211(-)
MPEAPKAPTGLPTVFDTAFNNAGQKPGVEIWRMEKFKVIKKPSTEKCYKGGFHEGDAYIILHTYEKANALKRDIYFWLGKDSSQDEQGTCAYKTVELDESLGGEPVQHREVQFHETDEFLSLWKSHGGIKYLEGGVDTGFKHVDREAFSTRLLHIKGRRNIRTIPVDVKPASLNLGDVFILDAGREIFQWNGPDASRVEKSKGLEVTKQIRDQERGGRAQISIIEHGKSDDARFWEVMGVSKPNKISPAKDDDEAHSRAAADAIRLYKISDATGKLNVEDITTSPLKKELLDTNDAYMLDTGAGIFVWIGKGASGTEKLHSMKYATDFLKQKGYPNHTPITRVVQGGETPLFKQNFASWQEPNALQPGRRGSSGTSKFVKKTFDSKALHQKQQREKAKLVDDGTGKLEIWRIEDFEMVPWDRPGEFYAGDSFVMLYTYLNNNKEEYIIYFWQGLESSQDEVGASALWAKELDDKYGGAPVQVRVVQNKEPPHFYHIFNQKYGGIVVHAGGKGAGWKNKESVDTYDTDGTRLFQVRGTNEYNTRAIQVPEKAASLNSGDIFIFETPSKCFMWYGSGCSGDEREAAKRLAPRVSKREFENVQEGKEPAEFWEALGGQASYPKVSDKPDEDEDMEPRLFQCSNARGYFWIEEIFDYDQEDLIEEDVMILDAGYMVFVWVGAEAKPEEKKDALKTAQDYVNGDPSGSREGTSIVMIRQGFEPPNFTMNFFAWNPNKWSEGKSYDELVADLQASNPEGGAVQNLQVDAAQALEVFSTSAVHPYSVLTQSADKLPEGVDATQKEQYLSPEEFQQYFNMSKEEFNGLPKWKQSGLKKKCKLF